MTDSFQESFVPGAKNSYDGEPVSIELSNLLYHPLAVLPNTSNLPKVFHMTQSGFRTNSGAGLVEGS